MNTFIDIIKSWPSVSALAKDIHEKPETVKKWRQRGSIPVSKWDAIRSAAEKRGIEINIEEMIRAAAA